MENDNSPSAGGSQPASSARRVRSLNWRQRLLLRVGATGHRLWCRTLRFETGADVRDLIEHPPPAGVAIIWHNRLFPAAEFYRRYFSGRKLAGIISSSRDGAWLAELFRLAGIRPVRGSRHHRGAQALRELVDACNEGYDVGVTPDGSRGPVYDMKPGAAMVALRAGRPLVLFSFNFTAAWRLNSWDRFYLPKPFSRVKVRLKRFDDLASSGVADAHGAAALLKREMDALTEDLPG